MRSFILLSLFIGFAAFAQETKVKEMNVTVYNDNLGVIREIREVELKSGLSEVRFTDVAKSIDPTSVYIKFNGRVVEQNYQYDLVNLYKILSRYLDREIMLVGDKNVIEGTLLSVSLNEIVLKQKDGGLIMLPKFTDYRVNVGALPEGLITKPTLVWKIESKQSGKQDFELTYQTSGMSWNAEYVGILSDDDKKMDFSAWVSINNTSGAAYKNAQLKLVAGDVRRVTEGRTMVLRSALDYAQTPKMEEASFEERSFFEYHIYELQGKTDISENETKQISLFSAQGVPIQKKYRYNPNAVNSRGEPGKVNVIVEFDNSKVNNLGIPLPKGKARINKRDIKSVEFIGEDFINHTPKDEKVKLYIGDAFDIVAEDKTVSQRKISDRVNEYEFENTFKNRKNEDIVIEMERNFGSNWQILSSNIPYEKKDAFTVIFKVPVKKNSEAKLEYKVRQSW